MCKNDHQSSSVRVEAERRRTKRLKSFKVKKIYKINAILKDRPRPEHKDKYRIKLEKIACFIILWKPSILSKLATRPPVVWLAGCGVIE